MYILHLALKKERKFRCKTYSAVGRHAERAKHNMKFEATITEIWSSSTDWSYCLQPKQPKTTETSTSLCSITGRQHRHGATMQPSTGLRDYWVPLAAANLHSRQQFYIISHLFCSDKLPKMSQQPLSSYNIVNPFSYNPCRHCNCRLVYCCKCFVFIRNRKCVIASDVKAT